MLGPVALHSLGRRLEAFLLAALIAAGVLASNALAYHDVSLAPRDRLGELETIGDRSTDRGRPSTQSSRSSPSTSSAWRSRRLVGRMAAAPAPLRNSGVRTRVSATTSMNLRSTTSVTTGRSSSAGRPRRAVLRLRTSARLPVGSMTSTNDPLGRSGPFAPTSPRQSCPTRGRAVVRCASEAGGRAEARDVSVPSGGGTIDIYVHPDSAPAGLVCRSLRRSHSASRPRRNPEDCRRAQARNLRYLARRVVRPRLRRAGGRTKSRRHSPRTRNAHGLGSHTGSVELSPGRRVIVVRRGGGDLTPGNGFRERLGTVALLRRVPGDDEVESIPRDRYSSLCGRTIDWLEIVR